MTACDLPVTARGVVTLVATNYGLFEPTGTGFLLREIAPGLTVEEMRAVTGGTLTVADGLKKDRGVGRPKANARNMDLWRPCLLRETGIRRCSPDGSAPYQSRSGAPPAKYDRNGRASSTTRLTDGRANSRARYVLSKGNGEPIGCTQSA